MEDTARELKDKKGSWSPGNKRRRLGRGKTLQDKKDTPEDPCGGCMKTRERFPSLQEKISHNVKTN
jgi:hypothetical protein